MDLAAQNRDRLFHGDAYGHSLLRGMRCRDRRSASMEPKMAP